MRSTFCMAFVLCFGHAALAQDNEWISYPHMSLSPVFVATSEDASILVTTGLSADSNTDSGCRNIMARSWAVDAVQELGRVCSDIGFGFPSALAVSPNGELVAVGNTEGKMLILSMASGDGFGFDRAHRASMGEGILGLSFNPAGDVVVSVGADGAARAWDTYAGEMLFTTQGTRGGGKALGVAHAPNGTLFATVHGDGQARIWQAINGEPHVFSNAEPAVFKHWPAVAGHSQSIYSVGFNPTSERLITGGGDRKAKVWDVATGEMLADLDQPDKVFSVAFSADGRFILAAALRTVTIFHADSFAVAERFEFENMVRNAVFSADTSKLFVSTHRGGAFGLDLPELN